MYKESRNLWPKQQNKVDLCSFLSLSILMNESQWIWQKMFFHEWRISNLGTNSYLLYPKHPALQSLLFLASTMRLWVYEDVNIFHNMRVIIVVFNSVQIQCLLLLCPCDHESVWHHTRSHQAEKFQFSHLHLIYLIFLHRICIVFVFLSDIPNTNKIKNVIWPQILTKSLSYSYDLTVIATTLFYFLTLTWVISKRNLRGFNFFCQYQYQFCPWIYS